MARNIIYTSTGDYRDSLRLKDLIGRQRVARFRPDQHPLGSGFAALQQVIIGTPQTLDEARTVGRLNLFATSLYSHEPSWAPYTDRLANDLSNVNEFLAIEFELEVMRQALDGRVRKVRWQRYELGTPDFRTEEPDMLVECKLLRVDELQRDTIFDAVGKARHQHAGSGLPFVVAIGFDKLVPPAGVEYIQAECGSRGAWIAQRPGISAVLLYLPSEPPRGIQRDRLGLPGLMFRHGTALEIVNNKATYRLPAGFSNKTR